jgi:hypothetical protein
MKQIKKTKVISKKTNKSLIKKNRKSTSMLKTVKKKTKKPVKITSVKVIKKPKKNKVKLSITYESKKLSDINVPRNITDKDIIVINELNPINKEVEELTEVRKKRRGRNKKEKIYFSRKTEEAIIEYNAEEDPAKRNDIYENRIKYSFDKLVENIFNTFKFTYFDNSPLEIQKETVAHLVSNIHKFESGKGKAFSYFSIVAKNYLIFHNNNNYKRFNQHVDISETPDEDSVCLQTEDAHHRDIQTKEFMKLLINYWEKNVTKIFTKQKDLNIAYAVIELFRNSDRIENFNKKTLYLYIRELSNCKTQQITKIINKMKSYQNIVMKNYINNGKV